MYFAWCSLRWILSVVYRDRFCRPPTQNKANLTYNLADSFSVNYKDIQGFRNKKKTSNKPSTTSRGGRRSAGKDSRQLGEEDRRMNEINWGPWRHTDRCRRTTVWNCSILVYIPWTFLFCQLLCVVRLIEERRRSSDAWLAITFLLSLPPSPPSLGIWQ